MIKSLQDITTTELMADLANIKRDINFFRDIFTLGILPDVKARLELNLKIKVIIEQELKRRNYK